MTTGLIFPARTIRFGEFEISEDRFELCRQGERVRIEPQALEVLTYLASHPGRLISKEELWQTLWRGRCVSDAAVAKQVREARRALGDDRRDPIWIKTVYARGAIFVGQIETQARPPASQDLPMSGLPMMGPPMSGRWPAGTVTQKTWVRPIHPVPRTAPQGTIMHSAVPRRTAQIRIDRTKVTAYDLMRRGKHLLRVETEHSCRSALDLFTRSAQLNPDSAQAHTGVAISSAHLWLYYATDRHQLVRGQTALGQARDQRPDLAETRHAAGLFEWIRGGRLQAASTFESILTTDTGLPECVVDFSRLCRLLDDPDRALRMLASDAWRRHSDYRVPLFTAMSYKHCNNVARTEEFHEKGVCAARQHLEVFPRDARAWSLGGAALAHLGNHQQALGWTRTATQLARTDGLVMYNASCIATVCGDRDGALTTLRALRDQRFPFRSWIEIDQDLDPLRDDPRFDLLLSSWPVEYQTLDTPVPFKRTAPPRRRSSQPS